MGPAVVLKKRRQFGKEISDVGIFLRGSRTPNKFCHENAMRQRANVAFAHARCLFRHGVWRKLLIVN
jgi:hypothetical protein